MGVNPINKRCDATFLVKPPFCDRLEAVTSIHPAQLPVVAWYAIDMQSNQTMDTAPLWIIQQPTLRLARRSPTTNGLLTLKTCREALPAS